MKYIWFNTVTLHITCSTYCTWSLPAISSAFASLKLPLLICTSAAKRWMAASRHEAHYRDHGQGNPPNANEDGLQSEVASLFSKHMKWILWWRIEAQYSRLKTTSSAGSYWLGVVIHSDSLAENEQKLNPMHVQIRQLRRTRATQNGLDEGWKNGLCSQWGSLL